MARNTAITTDQLEFVEGLADRFPDLTDHEVLNAFSEYAHGQYYDAESIDGRIVLRAYNSDATKAADYALTVWGVSVRTDG